MARFTSTCPLNVNWEGYHFRGPANTVFEVDDALQARFSQEMESRGLRQRLTWLQEDEAGDLDSRVSALESGGGGGGAHPNLAGHTTIGLATQVSLDSLEDSVDLVTADLASHLAALDPHPNYALDADLVDHADDTTGIHGIADTAELILEGDSRLSDARTPLSHSHTHDHDADYEALGHNHDLAYSLTGHLHSHNHDGTYSASGHGHTLVDGDIPSSIARDSEVTSAIAAHVIAEPHGEGGGGGGEAFPVGSVFIATVSTDPATLLGYGTWSAFAAGRVLVGIDAGQTEFDTVEETGGAKTHTHATHATAGAHTHDAHSSHSSTTTSGQPRWDEAQGDSRPADHATHASDGGHAHDAHSSETHLQPYIVVYMWKRTA